MLPAWNIFFLFFFPVMSYGRSPEIDNEDGLPCDSEIFCTGMILDTVQRLKIFKDSKTYVDLPLRKSPANPTVRKFAEMAGAAGGASNLTKEEVEDFINTYYDKLDADLSEHTLPDWHGVSLGGLPLYKRISDPALREFAKQIHGKWRDLGRNISQHVLDFPEQHSLIYVPHPFVVPGGRFDEIYYWDSYWVIQGLLVSNMTETALGMIRNFAHIIHEYGHMLNGNRVYYMKRSQPPIIAMIVDEYRRHPNVLPADRENIVKEILPALEREYKFWMTNRTIPVEVDGKSYTLNIFKGGIGRPRPESYMEDINTASHLLPGQQSEKQLWSNIAAAAESGWDFSTRWLDSPEAPFTTIRTETIVPVDLNSVLCAQERLMSEFYKSTGDEEKAKLYSKLALDRGDAIHAVFWNPDKSMWRDYDSLNNHQRHHFYLSAIAPVFARCSGRTVNITSPDFLKKLLVSPDLKQATGYSGGFPASFVSSPSNCCQWDYPDVWPPVVMMLIEGFAAVPEVRHVALEWAQKWISVVYKGYSNHSMLFEKYDVRSVGAYGTGGEYEVQVGFGWTNGGILRLVEMFPTELTLSSATKLHYIPLILVFLLLTMI